MATQAICLLLLLDTTPLKRYPESSIQPKTCRCMMPMIFSSLYLVRNCDWAGTFLFIDLREVNCFSRSVLAYRSLRKRSCCPSCHDACRLRTAHLLSNSVVICVLFSKSHVARIQYRFVASCYYCHTSPLLHHLLSKKVTSSNTAPTALTVIKSQILIRVEIRQHLDIVLCPVASCRIRPKVVATASKIVLENLFLFVGRERILKG